VPNRVTVTVATEKSVVRCAGKGASAFSSIATAPARLAFLRAIVSARNAW
jgi:hypothetical protein